MQTALVTELGPWSAMRLMLTGNTLSMPKLSELQWISDLKVVARTLCRLRKPLRFLTG